MNGSQPVCTSRDANLISATINGLGLVRAPRTGSAPVRAQRSFLVFRQDLG